MGLNTALSLRGGVKNSKLAKSNCESTIELVIVHVHKEIKKNSLDALI